MKTKGNSDRLLTLLLLVSATMNGSAVPPTIDSQPRTQTAILYQPAAFGVIAGGTSPLSYQWRKDGVPVPGATNDQIVFAHAEFSDAGIYSLTLSNTDGTATSIDAKLTVNSPKPGDIDYSFQLGWSRPVSSISVLSDNRVIIGNAVQSRGDNPVARLNPDGGVDTTFTNAVSNFNGEADSVAVQDDGKIVIGGGFIRSGTNPMIARLNADGTLDSGFQNGMQGVEGYSFAFPWVVALALQKDNKILMTGGFDTVNGIRRNGIARLNSDGSLDEGFNPGTGFGTYTCDPILKFCHYLRGHCLAVQSDGKVLVGGEFLFVDGVRRNKIARLNADGTLEIEFHPDVSTNGWVNSLALQNDCKILIGGLFTHVNGITRNSIARLNPDGTLDSSFLDGLPGASGSVASLSVQPDGKVLAAGSFTNFNGADRNRIVRLNRDGSLDTSFQSKLSGADLPVRALTLQSDGKILIGGDFLSVNDVPAAHLVRLWGNVDIAPQIKSLRRNGESVDLTWYAISNRTYRVQYNPNFLPQGWTDLPGEVVATGSVAAKTDMTLSGATQRFYRVLLSP